MQWLCHGIASANKLKTLSLYFILEIQPYLHLVKCPVLHGHIPEELLDARFHYWQRCGKKGVMGEGKVSCRSDRFGPQVEKTLCVRFRYTHEICAKILISIF
jgi:hypothetical protein